MRCDEREAALTVALVAFMRATTAARFPFKCRLTRRSSAHDLAPRARTDAAALLVALRTSRQ